ncbi:TonB-dependent receptor [Roseateles saccharophilus]|uniref:Outer membrane receptor protein involved in Fe transport n=1 Tax=Roseateles saccharophilus TaxID=304 RepID=A0A4R3UFC4_ROSSA|nr:TonB-dependent receptor [Roseateles saccharophilus]MDG0834893.1 TonB-dependent receptor [Roseateles saccharophilus]TCU88897.1 outer membrane receptor protein involved in Fe transport [Roseateles saccharophilus]
MRSFALAPLAAACLSVLAAGVHAEDASADAPAAPAADAATPSLQRVEVTGTRQRLDAARNALSPDTGSSIYRLDKQDLKNLPLGESTPLNQVLLQTPGVVQDSYGQLHVRGDHANVQYRINGVIIPESISGFGQALETRFADHLNVLTGALPAQYGIRNAAVVDIQSKGDTPGSGGSIGLTVGSRGHAETSLEMSGTQGQLNYFLTGSLLRNDIGIENPTSERNALHDTTRQAKSFGLLSYVLGDDSRVSLMFGTSNDRFQIPNVPGQSPGFTTDGHQPVDSATLDARQTERNRFVVATYQGALGSMVDYQLSVFNRVTDVHYRPDAIGDLRFNGIAADILRRNDANGAQADLSYKLNLAHTLRAGLFAQQEKVSTVNGAAVFPADAAGNQTSGLPLFIQDDSRITGHLWSAYLQDEWRPAKLLTINYGLRYDQVHTIVDEQQFSPRLGLVYEASQTLRLHAGYARYFTPPTTEKIDTTSVAKFVGTTNALPSDADTAVRSERSDYFDAGLSFQASPTLTFGIDGYYRKVQHLQDEGQFGKALIYSAFNFEQGRIYGLDLSATYKGDALNGYVNLGLSHARARGIESGQFNFDQAELDYIASHWVHLDHEQRVSGSAGLSYRFAGGLAASADLLFGSGLRRGFSNTEHLPGYASVNASLARTFDLGRGLGKFDTRLAVMNLFDRAYQLRDGSGIGVGAPQFGLRRSVYLTVSKPF